MSIKSHEKDFFLLKLNLFFNFLASAEHVEPQLASSIAEIHLESPKEQQQK
jgi:hypothetical protein